MLLSIRATIIVGGLRPLPLFSLLTVPKAYFGERNVWEDETGQINLKTTEQNLYFFVVSWIYFSCGVASKIGLIHFELKIGK